LIFDDTMRILGSKHWAAVGRSEQTSQQAIGEAAVGRSEQTSQQAIVAAAHYFFSKKSGCILLPNY